MSDLLFLLADVTRWGLTLYEWIIIIAILISWVSPDPSNPIIRFLNNMTLPLWNRLAAVLPGPLRLFAAYISLLLVWFLRIFAPGVLQVLGYHSAGQLPLSAVPERVVGFFVLGGGMVAQNLLFFLTMLLVVWFFMTLVSPSVNNPVVRTLYVLVDPFITPVQRYLPRGRIDFSPLIVAGAFVAANVFLLQPLMGMAAAMAYGGAPLLSAQPQVF